MSSFIPRKSLIKDAYRQNLIRARKVRDLKNIKKSIEDGKGLTADQAEKLMKAMPDLVKEKEPQ